MRAKNEVNRPSNTNAFGIDSKKSRTTQQQMRQRMRPRTQPKFLSCSPLTWIGWRVHIGMNCAHRAARLWLVFARRFTIGNLQSTKRRRRKMVRMANRLENYGKGRQRFE
jgi:hypothetical protein